MNFKNITDEVLHTLLSFNQDIYLPTDPIYIEVPLSDWEEKCDPDLGDGRKLMNTQFVGIVYEDCVYVMLGRSNTHTLSTGEEIPNGNYQELTQEEFWAWVNKYTIAKTHVGAREEV